MEGSANCSGEKYWKELSIEEKIERMRWQVKMIQHQMEEMLRRISTVEDISSTHSHVDGRVMKPVGLDSIHQFVGRPFKDTDETYF